MRETKPFGGLTPKEASQRSVEVRRQKAAERAEQSKLDALTVRQRLGVALSAELTVEDWRGLIRYAENKGKTLDLVRMADRHSASRKTPSPTRLAIPPSPR